MKKIYSIVTVLLFTSNLFAQAPQKMSYQAVIRDASDALVTSTLVGMRISILQDSLNGAAVYVETQTPTSNANGLVSIQVGTGTSFDDFSTIDWSDGPYFIKTETDPLGGSNYSISGTSELMSVPFALFSANGIAGPQGIPGADGTNGTNGSDGESAYQIAVNNGFVGTQAQWLASLQGPIGLTGPIGAAGMPGTPGTNGADGLTGPTGAQGPAGLTLEITTVGSAGTPAIATTNQLVRITGNFELTLPANPSDAQMIIIVTTAAQASINSNGKNIRDGATFLGSGTFSFDTSFGSPKAMTLIYDTFNWNVLSKN